MSENTNITRNQKDIYDDEAFSGKRLKTWEKGGVTPWSDPIHDVLFLVMMQLGVIDFLSISGVCKSWRSVALSNRKMFMASKQPMSMWIPFEANEKDYCYLTDIEGRKFKTIIPDCGDMICVGLTCGYLILNGGRGTYDFWLVNLITRHQLHFPHFPFPFQSLSDMDFEYEIPFHVKAILVFSRSFNEWVLIVLDKFTGNLWFCVAGEGAWNQVFNTSPVLDFHVFKGKIYIITSGCRVYEMRLNPELKLTLLEIKNFRGPCFLFPEFLSSGENLYVMNFGFQDGIKDMHIVQELDFGEMEWVMPEKTIQKYSFFSSHSTYSVVIKPEPSPDLRSQYDRCASFFDESQIYKLFDTRMWYFPHDCMNVNLIDE